MNETRITVFITGAGTIPALNLAPMAVLPEYQRHGIDSALVRIGLDEYRQGHEIVVAVGHTHFRLRLHAFQKQ